MPAAAGMRCGGLGSTGQGAPREEDRPRRGVSRHRGDHLHEGAPRLELREAASPQQPMGDAYGKDYLGSGGISLGKW